MGEVAKKSALILGGGDVLNYKGIATLITPETLIVCADSGYRHCAPLGIVPDLVVGDFDSIESLDDIPKETQLVKLPKDKNYTDTTFSIEAALHKECNQILMAGMWGGRIDHSLANIQSLVYLTRKGIESFITDGVSQMFCADTKGQRISCHIRPVEGYYLSLLAYSEECGKVTIENAVYTLDEYTLKNDLARAVSNEFSREEAKISFSSGTMLIVLAPKDAKKDSVGGLIN